MLKTETAPAGTPEESLNQLQRDIQTYIDRLKSGNAEIFAAQYEDGAIILPSGHEACLSKEDVTGFAAEILGAFEVLDVRMPVEKLEVGPAIAYHAAAFDMDMRPRAGGPVSTAPNKGIELWRRQPDGHWKVSRDVWNDANLGEPPQQKLLVELEKLSDLCSQWMKAGDLEGAALTYSDGVVLMPPEQPPVVGWPAAREWIRAWLAAYEVVDARIRIYHPIACGRLIYCRCRSEIDMRLRSDGSPQCSAGDGVMLVNREADGSLRVLWDLWPQAKPFEPAPEARELFELMERRSRQYEKDVVAKNVDGWASYFDENAVIMPNNAPMQTGRAALLEFGRAYFQAFDVQDARLDTVEMELSGDWAYRRLQYWNHITAKSGGERYLVTGHAMDIWRRSEDTWKVAYSVWTMNPTDGSEQDPKSGVTQRQFEDIARSRVAAQSENFLRNDVRLWAEYYSPHARLAGDNLGPMNGRTVFEGVIGAIYFDRYIYKAANTEILGALALGNYGILRLGLHFDLQPKEGGEIVAYTGSCIELWQRQPDGSWQTVDCIWTSDRAGG